MMTCQEPKHVAEVF